MASGRVGGSRSKISGAVGSEVYKIVKNPNGSYSQIVQKKGIPTVNTTTPKLQAQRMVTAMVESMMKQLKSIGNISMQSGVNKSKSLNAFSSMNLYRVARDMKAHWYEGNEFVYPMREADKQYIVDLGGPYLLSSGTLQRNLFSSVISGFPILNNYFGISSISKLFYGVRFNLGNSWHTVYDFCRNGRWTFQDKVAVCAFHHYLTDYNPETGDAIDHYEHSYCIAELNPVIEMSAPLDAETISHLFVMKFSGSAVVLVARDLSHFLLGFLFDTDSDEECYYQGQFSISYEGGRKLISSSTYRPTYRDAGTWLIDAFPANVFGSWMNEYGIRPYPSPFE